MTFLYVLICLYHACKHVQDMRSAFKLVVRRGTSTHAAATVARQTAQGPQKSISAPFPTQPLRRDGHFQIVLSLVALCSSANSLFNYLFWVFTGMRGSSLSWLLLLRNTDKRYTQAWEFHHADSRARMGLVPSRHGRSSQIRAQTHISALAGKLLILDHQGRLLYRLFCYFIINRCN